MHSISNKPSKLRLDGEIQLQADQPATQAGVHHYRREETGLVSVNVSIAGSMECIECRAEQDTHAPPHLLQRQRKIARMHEFRSFLTENSFSHEPLCDLLDNIVPIGTCTLCAIDEDRPMLPHYQTLSQCHLLTWLSSYRKCAGMQAYKVIFNPANAAHDAASDDPGPQSQ
ncbi:hypothetical protein VTL71DRAFT_13502 [Oculimacula yallundae]|uniref:Uncharacterized protein n=1 Tax=Oculimacula yallundae TaxID=86028 RepID=A0ABR4CM20_9HELO